MYRGRAMYERKGQTIRDLTTNVVTDYKSVSKAKKASHALQMKTDGALGRGSLVVK